MTDKQIYDEITLLAPYKTSKNAEFREVLGEALGRYCDIIKKAEAGNIDLDKDVHKDVCKYVQLINNIVETSYRELHSEAYKKFSELMNTYKQKGCWGLTPNFKEPTFYRMRIFENRRRNIVCGDMFHIPLNMRREIKTQRYSTSGHPCLYMGTSAYACWEEMGRPRMSDCWVSRLKATKDLVLLDMSVPYYNTFASRINRDIRFFPLIIACMIPVEEYECVYKPEYIIPQLVMEWLTTKLKGLDGVLYTSSMCGNDIDYPYEKRDNVAIPVKQPLSNTKFCPDLVNMFQITEPINFEFKKINNSTAVIDCGTYDNIESEEQIKINNYSESDFAYLEERLCECELKGIENQELNYAQI